MAPEFRSTGISFVGDVPWGTHFCSFYETKQDLLDILIPFFKTGLESNEFCLWIVSNSELLTMQEARNALQEVVPDLDRHITEKSIEVAGHDWFLNGGLFDFRRVANQFKEKVDEALARGYVGMRVNASPAWLETSNPKELRKFEAEVDQLYPHERIIASCTYPIGSSRADFLLDVARNHKFAIARRHGDWDIVETPELIQAKAEIDRLNAELEQRVIERTKKLEATTARLRAEIEERKEAEEALRQSEERFAAFMDNLPGYAWMKDLEGRYVYINETFLQFRNAVGKTDAELWPAEIASTYRANDNQVIQTKNALQTIEPFPKDPEQGCQIVSKFPILDQDGAVVMVGGASVDITERIEAEEAVRRSEEHLRLVIDTIPTMAWSVRPDGVVDFLNQRWLDYAGLSLEQYVEDPTGPIHPDDNPRVMEKWRAQMAIGEGYEDEMRLRRADGEYRWFLVRTEPLRDERGNLVKWYGSSTDIEDRKQSEEKLKATTEQLRALSASVQSAREEESKRIAREIHDELGGALTSWRWDLEEIRDEMSVPLDASQVATVRNEIERMIKLTETTLDMVRRLASELRPAALELGLVQGLEWQALQFENRTGIPVQLQCAVEKVDLDNGQATAVFRILQETLTNIQRHAQATHVTITCWEESDQLILTIKDNGRGITESEKSDRQSLGLLGMRERAHLTGGEINIESAEGEGTKITVQVPLADSGRLRPVLQSDS